MILFGILTIWNIRPNEFPNCAERVYSENDEVYGVELKWYMKCGKDVFVYSKYLERAYFYKLRNMFADWFAGLISFSEIENERMRLENEFQDYKRMAKLRLENGEDLFEYNHVNLIGKSGHGY